MSEAKDDLIARLKPVAWRVKDYADGWIFYTDEKRARIEAVIMSGALVEPLYSADALSSLVRERDAYAQATKDQAAIAMHNVNRATAAEADAARMREALEATEDMVYAAAVEQYNAGCDPSVYGEPKEKQHWFAYDILENLADAIRARASLSNTSEGGKVDAEYMGRVLDSLDEDVPARVEISDYLRSIEGGAE